MKTTPVTEARIAKFCRPDSGLAARVGTLRGQRGRAGRAGRMSSKGNMCRCAKRVPRGLSWRPAQARGVQGLPGGHTFKAERWGSEPSLSAWLDVPDRRAGEDQNFARDLWLPFISPEQKRSASPLPSPSRSIRTSFIARCWSTQTTSLERDGPCSHALNAVGLIWGGVLAGLGFWCVGAG